jgi:hypothetical protein
MQVVHWDVETGSLMLHLFQKYVSDQQSTQGEKCVHWKGSIIDI